MASPRGSIRRGEIKALAAPDIGKPKLLINACMKNQIHQTCVDCEVTRDALVPFVKGSHDVSSMDCCMFFQKQMKTLKRVLLTALPCLSPFPFPP